MTDRYRREPLITKDHGRASRTTITKHVYLATSPCFYNGGKCPSDRDPETCEVTRWGHASKCPGSVSPCALRRGYVTAARNAGQPKEVTGERVNMSGKILNKHYDKAHDEKAEDGDSTSEISNRELGLDSSAVRGSNFGPPTGTQELPETKSPNRVYELMGGILPPIQKTQRRAFPPDLERSSLPLRMWRTGIVWGPFCIPIL